jgi:hypothetical protein
MTNPVRYPNGVTNVGVNKTWSLMKTLDPSKIVQYFDDFAQHSDICLSSPTSHTVTATGAGTRAFTTIAGEPGGWLLLTNAAADDDALSIQHKSESFRHGATKPWAMEFKFRVSDATQSDILIGVAITDTTPLDATDRIAFEKSDGSASISLKLTKNSTSTTVGSTTISDATTVTLGAYYDPDRSEVVMLVDGAITARTSTLTNLCDDEELTPTIHIQNGEAVAKTMSIDFIKIGCER